MRALSVRNPYATMIMSEQKPYEFRTWQTDYRGDLLICSSANPKMVNMISGHALCVVRLNDIEKITSKNYKKFDLDSKPDGKMYAWQLTDIRLVKPFAVKGKLNFFDVDDSLIEVYDDGSDSMSEEEAERCFNEYYAPFMHTRG